MEALKSAERRKLGGLSQPEPEPPAEGAPPPTPAPRATPEPANDFDLILLTDEEPEPSAPLTATLPKEADTTLALELEPNPAVDSTAPAPASTNVEIPAAIPTPTPAPPPPSAPPPAATAAAERVRAERTPPPPGRNAMQPDAANSQLAPPLAPDDVTEKPLPAQQQLAATVFTAKQTGSARKHRLLFWGGVSIFTLLAAAYPGYLVWHELHPQALYRGPLPIPNPAPEAPPAVAVAPPAPTESKPTESGAAVNAPPIPAPDQPSPPSADLADDRPPPAKPTREERLSTGPDSTLPAPGGESRPLAAPPPPVAPPPPSQVLATPSVGNPAPGSGVKILRTTQGDPLHELLAGAYAAFLEGSLREANEKYQAILQTDPNNRDALLGLAAIANKKGVAEDALRLYTRLLELDPSDGLAQAGVLAFSVDSPQSESRIKTLLNRLPESDFLYFVLGNLYSRQGRWPEAEQSFYQACQHNGDNPDYAFNLAVSLDHLRQDKSAREYYRKALALAEHRPSAFDQVQAWQRLQELAPEQPR